MACFFDRIQSNIIPCFKRGTSSGGFSSDSDSSNQNMYEVAQKSFNINKREVFTAREALPPYNPPPCPFGVIGDPGKPKQPPRYFGNTNFPKPSYLQEKETFVPQKNYHKREDFNVIPISYQGTYNTPMIFQMQEDQFDYPMSFQEENVFVPLPIGYEKQKKSHANIGIQQMARYEVESFEQDFLNTVKDKYKPDYPSLQEKNFFAPRPIGYEKQKSSQVPHFEVQHNTSYADEYFEPDFLKSVKDKYKPDFQSLQRKDFFAPRPIGYKKQKSSRDPLFEVQHNTSLADESFEEEMQKIFENIINEPAVDFTSKPWKNLMDDSDDILSGIESISFSMPSMASMDTEDSFNSFEFASDNDDLIFMSPTPIRKVKSYQKFQDQFKISPQRSSTPIRELTDAFKGKCSLNEMMSVDSTSCDRPKRGLVKGPVVVDKKREKENVKPKKKDTDDAKNIMKKNVFPGGCTYCWKSGRHEAVTASHTLKDTKNRVLCPFLRVQGCPLCKIDGDYAHVYEDCPSKAYAEFHNIKDFSNQNFGCNQAMQFF